MNEKNLIMFKGDSMDKLEILEGSACFLVYNTSETMTKKQFKRYLRKEGFKEYKKYYTYDRGFFYINVNNLRYSDGIYKAANLANTIIDENTKNPFTIDEFKIIWKILKKHINKPKFTGRLSQGCSTFLICDNSLNNYENDFLTFLEKENFKPIIDDSYGGRGFVVLNVESMVYSTGDMGEALISTFVGNNSNCALTIKEFKTIWKIIKKHKDDFQFVEKIVNEYIASDDYDHINEYREKILTYDNSDADRINFKVSVLFSLKKYEEALDLLYYAIDIYPEDYRFYNFLAFICTDLYRISEAIKYFNYSFKYGGFDFKGRDLVYQYRGKCYLKKAREDFYIREDLDEALKSVDIYLNQFPNDYDIIRFKDELSHGYIDPHSIRFHEKLMYFECKAYELYKLGYLKQSFDAYENVLKASEDFKNNVQNTCYKWYDKISECGIDEINNFKWYDEVLSKNLKNFKGDYDEFFLKLFEITPENISSCIDKAKLYSKIYQADLAVKYSKKIVEKYPSHIEANKFYNSLTKVIEKNKYLDECDKFKNYNNINEYIDDIIFCLINSCGYSEEDAKQFVKSEKEMIKRMYKSEDPANDVAMDFYPLCG